VKITSDAHRLREITILQQRTLALEAELEQRTAIEQALRKAIADRDESSRLKDEFLTVVSHELRAPLNAILGWTQIATGQENDASTIRRALGIIQRNATAQLHVVNDLLASVSRQL
jgi:signal transduction histidine kinase